MKYVYLLVLIVLVFFGSCAQKEKEYNKDENNKKRIVSEKTQEPKNTDTPITQETPKESEPVVISEGQTSLYDKSENRINNIKLAASAVNGYKIAPYATFSFNEVVGERSESKGYKKAPILLKGEREYDYGGGVCQLSTTICMAAKNGGFEIKEQHNHKKAVDYAPTGEDAAVNYATLDFKFVNNTDKEITIFAGVYEDYIIVQLCGVKANSK